jgi:hypothetical protein
MIAAARGTDIECMLHVPASRVHGVVQRFDKCHLVSQANAL